MSGGQRDDARLGADQGRGQLTGPGQVDGHVGAGAADTSEDPSTNVLGLAIFVMTLATIGPAMLLSPDIGVYMAHSGQKARSPKVPLVV
ncbi:MAG: hypothetical protein V3S32_04575 [Acidimicrobiia bacterium]